MIFHLMKKTASFNLIESIIHIKLNGAQVRIIFMTVKIMSKGVNSCFQTTFDSNSNLTMWQKQIRQTITNRKATNTTD